MATPLGKTFCTNEKVVAQTNLKLLRSTIESLIVEFNSEKFEKLLSSGSISSKSTRQYKKVSLETRSQVFSKTSQRKPRTLFDKAIGLTFFEAPTASREANMLCANVSQETHAMTHGQYCDKKQSRRRTLLEASQIQFAKDSQQPLRTSHNVDCRRRRRARRQQAEAIEAKSSAVVAKREAQVETRVSVAKRDARS